MKFIAPKIIAALTISLTAAAASAVTFSEINDRVLTPACAGCHGAVDASADLDITKLENIKANLESIKAAVESNAMPMASELLPEDKALLLKWIEDGAPE